MLYCNRRFFNYGHIIGATFPMTYFWKLRFNKIYSYKSQTKQCLSKRMSSVTESSCSDS